MASSSAPAAPQSVTPHLIYRDAARALAFYRDAFAATEIFRLTDPQGRIGHAEIRIGNTVLMLCDEFPDFGALSAPSIGGSPIWMRIVVDDADQAVARAVAAGATLLRPVKDQFYGDRSGMIVDPFGFSWTLATPIEEVSAAEMQRRYDSAFA